MPSQLRTPEMACPLCHHAACGFERLIGGYQLSRCRRCGFVFVSPRPSVATELDLYEDRPSEQLLAIYDRIGNSPSVLQEYDERLERFEGLVRTKGRLLDFGCGAGHFHEMAIRRGWDAYGYEVGRWARDAATARGVPNLLVGNLDEVGLADNSFDVVNASQVLEHLPDPAAVVARLFRLLRPGGLLHVDVPNYGCLTIRLGVDDFLLNEPPQHLNYFVGGTLRRLLRGAGFRRVALSSGGGLKWELLLGWRIRSDRADAYGLGDGATGRPGGPGVGAAGSAATLKNVLKRVVVKPVLYERLRLGMLLSATGWRP